MSKSDCRSRTHCCQSRTACLKDKDVQGGVLLHSPKCHSVISGMIFCCHLSIVKVSSHKIVSKRRNFGEVLKEEMYLSLKWHHPLVSIWGIRLVYQIRYQLVAFIYEGTTEKTQDFSDGHTSQPLSCTVTPSKRALSTHLLRTL